jgi:excisionase family DNA binding protein
MTATTGKMILNLSTSRLFAMAVGQSLEHRKKGIQEMSEQNPVFLNYEEAAELLRWKKGTLYSYVSARKIPHYRISGKRVCFKRGELLDWIEARRVAPVAEPPADPHGLGGDQ